MNTLTIRGVLDTGQPEPFAFLRLRAHAYHNFRQVRAGESPCRAEGFERTV
jgi:hypothetical protein